MKRLKLKRRCYRQLFSKQEVVEMASYISCKADVKAVGENPGKFLEEKRGLKDYGTALASDQAFISRLMPQRSLRTQENSWKKNDA